MVCMFAWSELVVLFHALFNPRSPLWRLYNGACVVAEQDPQRRSPALTKPLTSAPYSSVVAPLSQPLTSTFRVPQKIQDRQGRLTGADPLAGSQSFFEPTGRKTIVFRVPLRKSQRPGIHCQGLRL